MSHPERFRPACFFCQNPTAPVKLLPRGILAIRSMMNRIRTSQKLKLWILLSSYRSWILARKGCTIKTPARIRKPNMRSGLRAILPWKFMKYPL